MSSSAKRPSEFQKGSFFFPPFLFDDQRQKISRVSLFSHNEDPRTTFSPPPTETWFRRLCSPRKQTQRRWVGCRGEFGGALGWIPAEEREGSGVRQREKLGCGAGTRSQPPPQGSWSKNGLEPGLPQEKGWSLYVSASRRQAAGKGV